MATTRSERGRLRRPNASVTELSITCFLIVTLEAAWERGALCSFVCTIRVFTPPPGPDRQRVKLYSLMGLQYLRLPAFLMGLQYLRLPAWRPFHSLADEMCMSS